MTGQASISHSEAASNGLGTVSELRVRKVRRKPTAIERRAEIHRRRLSRQGGFGLRDLDAISRERVQVWSLALAGWEQIHPEQDPERWARTANLVARALTNVERRLREVGLDGGKPNGAAALAAHVRANYGNRDEGSST